METVENESIPTPCLQRGVLDDHRRITTRHCLLDGRFCASASVTSQLLSPDTSWAFRELLMRLLDTALPASPARAGVVSMASFANTHIIAEFPLSRSILIFGLGFAALAAYLGLCSLCNARAFRSVLAAGLAHSDALSLLPLSWSECILSAHFLAPAA